MLILEDLKEINDVIKSLAAFIQEDEMVKPDFEEYIKTIGANNTNSVSFQSACFNYIFERNLGDNYKSIITLFLENSKKLSKLEKAIAKGLSESVSSIFEVKKLLKNGFELNNIINEKTYNVTSLVKMTSFRGIGSGQFIVARIFNYQGSNYLLEISGVLPSTKKDDALRYAVAKIIQNPELVYQDNPEKQQEIEENVELIYNKFIEYFGKDEIITTNKFADDIIGLFNDYAENDVKSDYEDKIQSLDEYNFFDVSEFNNSYDNFLENSLGGFSSHREVYDVGVIFDRELGLYAVPFYETFNKIFEVEDYTTVSNFAQCVEYFLINDKFSANIIKRVAAKHPNFMDVVNKVLNTDLTLDELLKRYKSRYLENKIFSSTTVLYKSKAFSKTLGIIEEEQERPELDGNIDLSKVGRNDACPCGSGKKFKKCCGSNL